MNYNNEPLRTEMCEKLRHISFTHLEGIFSVWDLAEQVIKDGVDGDMVEAGVEAGAIPIAMSHVCRLYDQKQRKVRMFDSFVGHPACLDYEDELIKKSYGTRNEDQKAFNNSTMKASSANCRKWVKEFNGWAEIIEYHVGFFQDTFLTMPDFKIALLRTDVNLIESHRLCMKYLYSRLQSGGYFISDDYLIPVVRKEIHELMKLEGITEYHVISPEKNIIYFKKK